jgi:hypothetical protein
MFQKIILRKFISRPVLLVDSREFRRHTQETVLVKKGQARPERKVA